MWWPKRVRKAQIDLGLRTRIEQYGEDVLAHAVGAGEHSDKGPDLNDLLHNHRPAILEWLSERRDIEHWRELRQEVVELAILLFVFIEVAVDLYNLIKGRPI